MLLGGNVDVINDAPHAGIVERGARPHSVSEDGRMALRLWVKRNLGAELRLNMREQFGKVRRLDFEAQIDAIVWGICHKLRREGQKPRWIVRDRMPLLERMLKIEVERRLARVAAAGGAK